MKQRLGVLGLFLGLLVSVNAFAGGIHFHDAYTGASFAQEVRLQVNRGTVMQVQLTVNGRQSEITELRSVSNSLFEGVFEFEAQGEKFKVVTAPPCTDVDALQLIFPSGMQLQLVGE